MIFDPTDEPSEKLHKASQHFLQTLGAHAKRRKDMQKAFAFRHGDQWDSEAKKTLENEGRPCLTFNLIAPVMRELIGANQDQRREAKAAPVGAEDLPTADTINHLWQREYEAKDFPDVEDQVFDSAVTCGVGHCFLDAQPSYDDPTESELCFDPVSPFEVLYDINARRTNLEDSKYFYWSRWMPETEFKRDYPDYADDFERLASETTPGAGVETDRTADLQYYGRTPMDVYKDAKFYDGSKHRIRVIRLFYEVPVKNYFAWDPRDDGNGQPIGMGPVKRNTYLALKKAGLTETYSSMGCEWRWFEFTGLQILFDDKQPLPIQGPQLRSFTCYYDEMAGYHYGMVRDLQDPQMEFNKRYSQELDHVNKQVQPGMFADKGAFGDDDRVIEKRMRRPGFLITKMPGSEIVPVAPPQIPAASETLAQRAQGLVSVISGVDTNPMLGGQPADVAVGTALLSHRKGLLSISPILTNFRAFQRGVLNAVVRTILQTFSDEQIEAMLGDSEKLRVQNGVVVDQQSGSQVALRDLRAIKWNIEMDSAAANTTQQLLILQMFQGLAAGGIPIDPEVMFEAVPVSRDTRQKLIAYMRASNEAAQKTQQTQADAAKQQVDDVLKIEMSKVAQRAQQAATQSTDANHKMQLDLIAQLVETFVSATSTASSQANERAAQGIAAADHELKTIKTAADVTLAHRAQRMSERQPTAA